MFALPGLHLALVLIFLAILRFSPFGMRMCTLSQHYVLEGVFLVLQRLPYLFCREFALNLRGDTQLGIWKNGSITVSLEMDFMHFVFSNGCEPLTHGVEYCVLV